MMIHRRILEDDDRGVNEPLDETEADGSGLKQRVRHCVVFGSDYRKVQLDKDQKVKVTIA